jgi:hypothetical protein
MKKMNPLDVLFRDIQRQMNAENDLLRNEKPKAPEVSQYANPLNWTLGRVVELIHRDEGSLGNFQEYFHKLSPSARRLLPAGEGLTPTTTELVWGEFWLHPKFQAPAESDSEEEIKAVTLRFQELMDEEFEI